ncbi:diaminopimelate epimerase [Chlorogloeopsis sp. ULAP01]|uniref:diaminopimelate epimerase n=1 Tax=Chlorogloeopsis sp. ULAP01 TaxID=3056483 RepID=UPI0025AB1576|nr:diaminopimelate epimerase [Chlorogloeopsis sp. ULAP01]MDM9384340.1 diaminopimelate epimerase [Chlorogloeopsis sp. ULAP01]
MKFYKYHALGNDYVVLDPKDFSFPLNPEIIRVICHRNFGIGSDGILWGPLPSDTAQFVLRIYNPDGSEAEKSGNGLRIFSRYLWDKKLVGEQLFSIQTLGGLVQSVVKDAGRTVQVEMGKVSFWSDEIPVIGDRREVIQEQINCCDRTFSFCAATIGNPHCVIPLSEITPAIAKQYGQLLEVHPFFPNRTNVQFMKVLNRNSIQIEIWERGAGYTLASGSSSSAAAAVAHKLGLCDPSITVQMPGGVISIEVNDDFMISMTGAVTKVAEGEISAELFDELNKTINFSLYS